MGEGAFDGLGALTHLDLSRNGLASLAPGAFRGLARLAVLDLSSNGLESLPAGALAGLAALESLDLRGNPLQAGAPSAEALAGVPSLVFLSLPDTLLCLPRGLEVAHVLVGSYEWADRRVAPEGLEFCAGGAVPLSPSLGAGGLEGIS